MHGAGMVGDLLVLGFYMIGAVIWMYFWLLCVAHRSALFGPMNGLKWLLLVSACIVVTAVGLYLAAVETFHRDNADWWLVLASMAIPVMGIQAVRLKLR
ncbi:hypothetical protein [Pseudomonas sp. NUPR-001]|uniref:hypothetical protein n=1 Tax=Pseudomonas sp. NUPR-001 TaxID=3416058 RepID=UPI003F960570